MTKQIIPGGSPASQKLAKSHPQLYAMPSEALADHTGLSKRRLRKAKSIGEVHLKKIQHAWNCQVEIVRWPTLGTRPVDEDTGDEADTTEGVFVIAWRGDILYGQNEAVGGHYILAYAIDPAQAQEGHDRDPAQMLLWHANYHPDGGQLFFPLDKKPFYVPLALPGDDIAPERFVCFRFTGEMGLYIHPGIWHEGVFTARGKQRFFDKQGAVHARVSVDFAREFSCLLGARLPSFSPSH